MDFTLTAAQLFWLGFASGFVATLLGACLVIMGIGLNNIRKENKLKDNIIKQEIELKKQDFERKKAQGR